MYIVLYSWKIKPELEEQFIRAWAEVTDYYVSNHDSLGSRLHKGSDGKIYAYAQWKSAEQREKAFADSPVLPAGKKMREAVEEKFPEIEFDLLSDFLKIPA
jgi:heme-degrading monooxygenase HmoA